MNHQEILSIIKSRYPGHDIIEIPPENPKEIIIELEETADFSRAVAVIEESVPHFHKKMTEVYTILEGTLTLRVDRQVIKLEKGQQFTIKPGTVHWATGEPTWVQVDCFPAWCADDHILLNPS